MKTKMNYKIILILFVISLFAAGCAEPLSPNGSTGNNSPPKINSLVAEQQSLKVGQSTKITVDASDQDGGQLTYSWYVTLGDIIGSGTSVLYSAAYCCSGINNIRVTVKDSKGATAIKEIKIYVTP